MKTRSNDIIPNAPFKYNSDTNTFEIGTNLYIDGNTSIQGDLNTYGGIVSFGDSLLAFYLDNNEKSRNIVICPIFGDDKTITQLAFFYNLEDDAESYNVYLDLDKSSNIVTDKKLKTLFGNKSLYGSGNIDLYKHYLTISVFNEAEGNNYDCHILIQSSSNVDCSSSTGATQKLKELLKCDNNNRFYESGVADDGAAMCILYGSSSLLRMCVNTTIYDITKIVDRVETI